MNCGEYPQAIVAPRARFDVEIPPTMAGHETTDRIPAGSLPSTIGPRLEGMFLVPLIRRS